jgi:hypothetical protein
MIPSGAAPYQQGMGAATAVSNKTLFKNINGHNLKKSCSLVIFLIQKADNRVYSRSDKSGALKKIGRPFLTSIY